MLLLLAAVDETDGATREAQVQLPRRDWSGVGKGFCLVHWVGARDLSGVWPMGRASCTREVVSRDVFELRLKALLGDRRGLIKVTRSLRASKMHVRN